MSTYYNENDPKAAAWLRALIQAGEIAPGDVDERSILEVQPEDLNGYTQAHFFAGIGGWSHALRLAGWPDERPVWTGSCPCQPFSSAGKRKGTADDRHLWPVLSDLIQECRPATVIGEQVASKGGLEWLDLVSADLEREGYAFGAADLCAAGVGAPHIRQRLYWVAHRDSTGCERPPERQAREGGHTRESGPSHGRLDDTDRNGLDFQRVQLQSGGPHEDYAQTPRAGAPSSFWDDPDWVLCDDPKGARWRPVEAGTFPLAPRVPGIVGRLRGYGNAIVPQVAAEFIGAYLEGIALK